METMGSAKETISRMGVGGVKCLERLNSFVAAPRSRCSMAQIPRAEILAAFLLVPRFSAL